jgi:hypothetical protein
VNGALAFYFVINVELQGHQEAVNQAAARVPPHRREGGPAVAAVRPAAAARPEAAAARPGVEVAPLRPAASAKTCDE